MVKREWWRDAVFYQIYPRSFQDSDGDGIGDLQGISDRLEYLEWLGVDALWLSPTFPSPMADFGYDVSDYLGVHPDFGTMETMERLIGECHRRGIRLLLDYVPNHTSEEHPWFLESRASRESKKRDWYIWRDPKPDGSPPNNWRSAFGGPAWTLDEPTGQYYLHSFLKEQPDLNWRNPDVEAAMLDVLRFWLQKGVDGFRIDVMGMVVKHPDLLDNPRNPDWVEGDASKPKYLMVNNRNHPEVHEAVRKIRGVFDEFPGTMCVAEVFGEPEEVAAYYGGEALDGVHLAFNFQLICDRHILVFLPWEARAIADVLAGSAGSLPPGAQACFALNNHDRPRFVTRNNHDGRGLERARAAALLLLGMECTPFLYQGEEIGMEDVEVPEDRMQDPARFRSLGRDPSRTPMPWARSLPGRGFTTGEPWLPFGEEALDVASQREDGGSLLALYREALRLRRAEPSLHRGNMTGLQAEDGVLIFERRAPGARPVGVVLNTTVEAVDIPLPESFRALLLASREGDATINQERVLRLAPLAAAWMTSPEEG